MLFRTKIIPPSRFGPDVKIESNDFDGDGIPEFVATSFFLGKISIFGAPCDSNNACLRKGANTWFKKPRAADISIDQGRVFGIKIADLNNDGSMDILATNHQYAPDCRADNIPGRVYALEKPVNGDIFMEKWTTHIILDNILPTVTPPGSPAGCRFAPGGAISVNQPGSKKPWIFVSGDQASKVWLLQPTDDGEKIWSYNSTVIFDIDEFYGPNTTQTPEQYGFYVSTIGALTTMTDSAGVNNIFIPVYEGRQIQIYQCK